VFKQLLLPHLASRAEKELQEKDKKMEEVCPHHNNKFFSSPLFSSLLSLYPGRGGRQVAVRVTFKALASACEIAPTRTPKSMQRLTVASVSGSHTSGGIFPDCSCCTYLPHTKMLMMTGGTVFGSPGIVGMPGMPGKPVMLAKLTEEFLQSP
jgi:hypothetical protein